MAKIAIVTASKPAAELGRQLFPELTDCHLYLNEKFATGVQPGLFPVSGGYEGIVPTLLENYERIVFVMSVATTVNLLGSHIKGKSEGPAVVVVDEGGRYAISLLDGKREDADTLCERIGAILNAAPVVTTATETHKVPSPDLLGREHGWEIQNRKHLKSAAGAMVAGEPVAVVQHAGERDWLEGGLPPHIQLLDSLEKFEPARHKACLLISDRAFDPEVDSLPEILVVYRPKSLVIGIDCTANPKADFLQMAITKTLMDSGLSFRSIRFLAAPEENRKKSGLSQFAARHHFPVHYFGPDTISGRAGATGSGATSLSPCEVSALLACGGEEIVVPATKVFGQITVGVARYPITNRPAEGEPMG
ncbi:MAG: cobalamin biosynthesis protein [Planctomycetes bacterium]|nr:cobalamin biosynthesis protein [Planctomycetota bacterium]